VIALLRRHAAAALAALLAPPALLLASTGLGSHGAAAAIDVKRGQDLFVSRCISCHDVGQAIGAAATTQLGPPLSQIGSTAARRRQGLSAPEYILQSILTPEAFRAPGARGWMPSKIARDLGPEDVRSLVAFLAGLGAEPDLRSIAALRIDPPDPEAARRAPRPTSPAAMELALSVFRGKGRCASCHSGHPWVEYQLQAPGLIAAGLLDPDEVRQAIVDPHRHVADFYRLSVVTLSSGELVTGRIARREAGFIDLLLPEPDGPGLEIRRIALEEIARGPGNRPLIEESPVSAMPAGFAELLTAEEIEALVTLIVALN
jgi:mono/diheme cytochrome c family protein